MGIVVRQSLKGTLANYAGALLGAVTTFVVVTRYIAPNVIGLTQVIYNVSLFFSTFCMLAAGSSGMRFYPYFRDEKTRDHGFLFYYLLLPLVGSCIFVPLFILLRPVVIEQFARNAPEFDYYYYWCIPLMLILTFWVWSETYANIHMRIAVPKAIREIGMRVFLLVAYLSYAFGLVDVPGMIVMMFVGYGICMLTTGTYALRIGNGTMHHDWSFLSAELKRKIYFFTAFLLVSAIAGQILSLVDIMMLSGLKGFYSTGVYTIAMYMANVIDMPNRSIGSITSPLAAQAMKDGDVNKAREHYRKVSLHQFMSSSLILVVVWSLLDDVYAIIPNGEIYRSGMYVVLFLGIAKVIASLFSFGYTLIGYSRYYWVTLVITIVLTGLSIATNLYCIPKWGVTGAAVATLVTALVSYSFQQFVVQILLHTNPLTWAHLRVVVVIVVLLVVDALLPSLTVLSPWLDLVVRLLVFAAVVIPVIYRLQISEQVNNVVDSSLRRVWRK